MIEYIYFGTTMLFLLWALVNELDDRAESKKKNRQLIASDIARMNLRNSDKQFTYDTQPPVGLSKKQIKEHLIDYQKLAKNYRELDKNYCILKLKKMEVDSRLIFEDMKKEYRANRRKWKAKQD